MSCKSPSMADVAAKPFFKADLRSLMGFGISGFFLWLLIRQSSLEWKQVQQALSSTGTIAWMAAAGGLLILFAWLHSVRTRIIFLDKHTSMRDTVSFPSIAICHFYNSVLPGNLGEAVRVWHFSRINSMPVSKATGVVILEKILDSNFLVPLMIVTLLAVPFANFYAPSLVVLLAGIATLDIILLFIHRSYKIKRLLFGLLWKKPIRRFFLKVYLHYTNHVKRLWHNNNMKWYFAMAYCMYFVNGLQHFAVMKALNLPPELFDFTTFNLLNLCMAVVAIVPSAPGNVGVAHYGIYATLLLAAQIKGVPPNHAQFALTAICIHFTYFIPDLLLGSIFVLKERRRLFIV
jgi:uncharacterized protein (TIRG00374 family)